MNIKLFGFCCTALVIGSIQGCAVSEQASITQSAAKPITVRKSPNDDRDYRYLELSNKMRVLLVSDPSTDKAAAALSIYRGSFHEPASRPGLAHFLEHMLFIGTEKYPEVDSFQNFITGNGGSSNAYTAQDHTNYFFDIQTSGFNEGLDRFAHFFIDPLLSPEYVEREKNAVHSEYQMQIKDDGWRGYMVSKRALNPEHPGHRFTIGSLETLKGDVGSDLMTFFAENYSADQMGLVILADQSLDELEALVTPLFNQVKNTDIGSSYPDEALFTRAQLPAVLTSISLKEKYQIAYNFPMPNTREVYKTKPEQYISNLLGHEGKGSLHSVLNERGWIESLGAGTQSFDRQNSLLSISIELTEKGRSHIPQITDLLFQYIDLLKAGGPEERIYLEQAKVAELGFRFQEKGSTVGFVYQMAPRLDEYPAEDLLVAPYLMEGFDAALISKSLSFLRKDNVFMEISAPDLKTDQVEPWFNVPYSLSVGEIETVGFKGASLNLPPANPYLPNNLTLLPEDNETISRVTDRPDLQVWLDTDVTFGTPRANTSILLLTHGGLSSQKDRAYAELYRRLVNDTLSTTVYPAYLAGLGYALGSSEAGFSISLNGYQDKQMQLLDTVIDHLFNAELTQERFATFKTGLIKDWQNSAKDKPYTQTLGALNTLLVSSTWSPAALADTLAPLSLNELKNWRTGKLAKIGVIAGLHGNVSAKDAQTLQDFLQQKLPMAAIAKEKSSVTDITEQLLLNLNVDHNDAALLLYVQDPDDSFASRAKSGLAGQILRSAYFSSLRTDQQLGYVVNAGIRRLNTRSGNLFLVQSPKAGAADLELATLTFMQNYADSWQNLSDAEFAQQKSGLISRLTESDKNLGQRSQKYWQNLNDENYNFDSNEQIAAEVEKLSKAEMGEFMQDILKRLKSKRILIFSPGKFEQTPSEGRVLENSLAFKK